MKYLLSILCLFVLSCDEDKAINPFYGCTDIEACNFDPSANISNNTCIYEIDECGECGGPGPDQYYDCDGICIAETDLCGVCGGSETDDPDNCINNVIGDWLITLGICESDGTYLDSDTEIFTFYEDGTFEFIEDTPECSNQTWSIEGYDITLYISCDFYNGEFINEWNFTGVLSLSDDGFQITNGTYVNTLMNMDYYEYYMDMLDYYDYHHWWSGTKIIESSINLDEIKDINNFFDIPYNNFKSYNN